MLILFPLLECNASYVIYGKSKLFKNDGGFVNVCNPICEAGVQPVEENANEELEESSKPETTLTLNLRVYFLFSGFHFVIDTEGHQFSSGSFHVSNFYNNSPF